jgi:hypothetical protein
MARCVWALADEEIIEHLHCLEEGRAREWLATLIATLLHEDQIRVFVTLWAIWHARRKAIHEQIYQSPLTVHHFVARFVEELSESETRSGFLSPCGRYTTAAGNNENQWLCVRGEEHWARLHCGGRKG